MDENTSRRERRTNGEVRSAFGALRVSARTQSKYPQQGNPIGLPSDYHKKKRAK